MRPRGQQAKKSYTDELQTHWQKQFTEKAADPGSLAYTEHNSGLGSTGPVMPPPADGKPPSSYYEPAPPAQAPAAVVLPPASGVVEGGPMLFSPPPQDTRASAASAAHQSRYPDPQSEGYNYGSSSIGSGAGVQNGTMGGQGSQMDVGGTMGPNGLHNWGGDSGGGGGGSEPATNIQPIEQVKAEVLVCVQR